MKIQLRKLEEHGEITQVKREIRIRSNATAQVRHRTFQQRDHLVVPVVALMEGVVWPSNAVEPELVTAECLSIAPLTWNGRPCVPDHPSESANEPTLLEQQAFGSIFNTEYKDKKLTMEAWIDVEKAKTLGGLPAKVLERAQQGKPIEVSVGAYVQLEQKKGEFNGRKYGAVWIMAIPDHLALLPEGVVGACSNKMGCGAPRTARLHVLSDGSLEVECEHELASEDEPVTTTSLRERLKALLPFIRINNNQLSIEDVQSQSTTEPVHASSCGCGGTDHSTCGCHSAEENTMTKGERVKALIAKKTNKFNDTHAAFLETLSDDALKAIEDSQVADGDLKEVAAATTTTTTTPVAENTQNSQNTPTLTAEALKAIVTEAITAQLGGFDINTAKSIVANHLSQQQTRKQVLVTALKDRASVKQVYNEERLNSMTVEGLEELNLLTQNTSRAGNVADFSAGVPAVRSNADASVPKPPDMIAKIKERYNAQKGA